MRAEDWKDRAVKHIRECDKTFRRDYEFAYQQMRVLALELIAELEEAENG